MNAQCMEGRCECLPGFEGDGILKCEKKGGYLLKIKLTVTSINYLDYY